MSIEPDAEGAIGFVRRRDLPLLAQIERDLTDVDVAMTRLDDGTYGTCEVCGDALADGELAIDPMLRRCPEHRSA